MRKIRQRIGRPDEGFTMIELLVVMGFIVTLSSVALVQYRNSITYAKETALKDDLYKMRDAINQYYADKGQYPPSLDALVTQHYLRGLPPDPFTNAADTWQAVPAEPDPHDPTVTGIEDVRSGSDRTALNGGRRYADW